jgi:excinuclease ABC subunit B
MYAEDITGSMSRAISETNRRRAIQSAYNVEHNITPASVKKAVRDIIEAKKVADNKAHYKIRKDVPDDLPLDKLMVVMADLEKDMKRAAKDLDFEQAAELRDEIARLKKLLPTSARK